MKIWELPISVLVWVQPGCPACHEYVPRFRRVAERYGRCITSIIADVSQYGEASDAYQIAETPTTLLLAYGRRVRVLPGAQSDEMIEALFATALRGGDCTV